MGCWGSVCASSSEGPPDQRLRCSPEDRLGEDHLHPSACSPPGCTSWGAQGPPPSLQTPPRSNPAEPGGRPEAPVPDAPACVAPCLAVLRDLPGTPRGRDPRAGATFPPLLSPRWLSAVALSGGCGQNGGGGQGARLTGAHQPPVQEGGAGQIVLERWPWGRRLRSLGQEDQQLGPPGSQAGLCPGGRVRGPGPSPWGCRFLARPEGEPTSIRPVHPLAVSLRTSTGPGCSAPA